MRILIVESLNSPDRLLSVFESDISLLKKTDIKIAENLLRSFWDKKAADSKFRKEIDPQLYDSLPPKFFDSNFLNETDTQLYYAIPLINWLAYKNAQEYESPENEKFKKDILDRYSILSEKYNEPFKKEFNSLLTELYERSLQILGSKFCVDVEKKFRDSCALGPDKKSVNFADIKLTYLKLCNYLNFLNVKENQISSPKRECELIISKTAWTQNDLNYFYDKLKNYYQQIGWYIGDSEKLNSTKQQIWAVLFGRGLKNYLNRSRLGTLSKQTNVLILGETGTGKETVAKAICGDNVISLNIAAIGKTMIEAALFGVGPGSATGVSASLGFFLKASGYALNKKTGMPILKKDELIEGALFLDEIGDISEDIQVKLLRVIETQKVRRVGEEEEYNISVKVITATNKPIFQMIEKGIFRRDLFERMVNGGVVRTYPLNQRKEDIHKIAENYFQKNHILAGSSTQNSLLHWLENFQEHTWPGNVRELQRAVDYFCSGIKSQFEEMLELQKEAQNVSFDDNSTLKDIFDKPLSMKKVHDLYIEHVLDVYNGNQSISAEVLGISRQKIYQYLKNKKTE